jgi:ABC-2 family transporter protein
LIARTSVSYPAATGLRRTEGFTWAEASLTSFIDTVLNGTKTGSHAPYAISSQPPTSLGSLQARVKQGNLDILLVLERLPNQALRFTYDTHASSTSDPNLQTALFGASTGGFIQQFASVSIPFYLLFLVYLLLAFFLYATLYAGLGALVKRPEEVQSATMLPTLLVVSGYLLFFVTVATPDATLTKVLSYIPIWSPVLMLMRLAVGTVAWWEIVMTIALMLLTILVNIWFAARLYRLGVLLYGQRPSFSTLMKLLGLS